MVKRKEDEAKNRLKEWAGTILGVGGLLILLLGMGCFILGFAYHAGEAVYAELSDSPMATGAVFGVVVALLLQMGMDTLPRRY